MAYETDSPDETRATRPVAQALARFKIAAEADSPQRKRELEALKFVDEPNGQWPDDVLASRAAGEVSYPGIAGSVRIAARPCLTINKTKPPVKQVVNQARKARLSVKLSPKAGQANVETGEMLQGLYRNIEVESRAQVARMWALDRAAKCGRGYYRILKTYANDGDDDLDLVIKRILNQHAVYLDPFHQEPDGSDAEWAFIVADVPFSRFKREFPDAEASSMTDQQLTSLGDEAPGWMNGDGESRTIRIAEYFCVKYEKKTRVRLTDGRWVDEDAVPKKLPRGVKPDGRTREVEIRRVHWQKINCVEVLEEQEWEGRYIPIVQVIGDESNINGQRRYTGLVEDAMDPQRMYNYMASSEAEAIGLAPKAPWLVAEGTIEGYEAFYAMANTRNLAWLPYRLKTIGTEVAPPPQRQTVEPAIQAITLARRNAADDIQATTGQYDPSLGRADSPRQSGRAILALREGADEGNSQYLDNLATIAMTHEARIILDLMPYVYDRPGRIVQILGADYRTQDSVMLNAPFVVDQAGVPQPAQAGGDGVKHYRLTPEDRYAVAVSVGRSFTTQRDEASAMMGELAQAAPQLVPLFADLWIGNLDFPGASDIAERLKKTLLPPELRGDQPQAGIPPEAQQAIAQLQQQLAAAGAELQKLQSGLAAKELEVASKERIAIEEIGSKERIAALQAETKRLEAAMRANLEAAAIDSEEARAVYKTNVERELEASRFAHETAMADADRVAGALDRAADASHETGV